MCPCVRPCACVSVHACMMYARAIAQTFASSLRLLRVRAMARTRGDRERASACLRHDALKQMAKSMAASAAMQAASAAAASADPDPGAPAASAARDLDFVELFAGDHAVSRGLRAMGYKGLTFDNRTVDARQDILTPVGFLAALAACQRLRPNGLLFAAPVCSSWVFMSRCTTERDISLAGAWASNAHVKAHNAMAARVAALCHFAASAGCHFVVEQPSTSVMFSYRPWLELRTAWAVHQIRFPMAAYGGGSLKPSWLIGTAPWLVRLRTGLSHADRAFLMTPPVSTAVVTEDGLGRKRATGSSELKGTQAYPLQFGAALAVEFDIYAQAVEMAVASATQAAARSQLESYEWTDSANMEVGAVDADVAAQGDDEMWANPDWFIMDIVSNQPRLWDH